MSGVRIFILPPHIFRTAAFLFRPRISPITRLVYLKHSVLFAKIRGEVGDKSRIFKHRIVADIR